MMMTMVVVVVMMMTMMMVIRVYHIWVLCCCGCGCCVRFNNVFFTAHPVLVIAIVNVTMMTMIDYDDMEKHEFGFDLDADHIVLGSIGV